LSDLSRVKRKFSKTTVYILMSIIVKKLSLKDSVKMRPIKQQRSFCYATRCCALLPFKKAILELQRMPQKTMLFIILVKFVML